MVSGTTALVALELLEPRGQDGPKAHGISKERRLHQEVVDLVGPLDRRCIDDPDLVVEQRTLAHQLLWIATQRVSFGLEVSHRGTGGDEISPVDPPERIERPADGGRAEQGLVLMLSVDVAEPGSLFAQDRQRTGSTVDPGLGASLCRNLPRKDDLRPVGTSERCLDVGRSPVGDNASWRATAHHQCQGVDEQRLSRTRLSRQRREPRSE